jgi:hypothetical protein
MTFIIPSLYPKINRPVYSDEMMLRDPWLLAKRQAPRGPVKVNWDNPITKGLIELVIPNRYKMGLCDLVNGTISYNAGIDPPELDAHRPGRGIRTRTVSSAWNYELLSNDSSRAKFTIGPGWISIFCLGMIRNVSSDNPMSWASSRIIYGFSPYQTVGNGIAICHAASNYIWAHVTTDVAVRYGALTITTVPTNVPFVAFAMHDVESNYFAGQVENGTFYGIGTPTTPTGSIGNWGGITGLQFSSSAPGDKTLFIGAAWNRQLSDSEKYALVADPYSIVIPA